MLCTLQKIRRLFFWLSHISTFVRHPKHVYVRGKKRCEKAAPVSNSMTTHLIQQPVSCFLAGEWTQQTPAAATVGTATTTASTGLEKSTLRSLVDDWYRCQIGLQKTAVCNLQTQGGGGKVGKPLHSDCSCSTSWQVRREGSAYETEGTNHSISQSQSLIKCASSIHEKLVLANFLQIAQLWTSLWTLMLMLTACLSH